MNKLREDFESIYQPIAGVFWDGEEYTTEDQELIPDMDFCNDMFGAFKVGYEAAKTSECNLKLLECLSDISSMCIGDIALGYRLEAETIGQMIYGATGLTQRELLEFVRGESLR